MVEEILFGTLLETEAVVEEIPQGEAVRRFQVDSKDGALCFSYKLRDEDIVYGLGETMRGINKRGGRYVSFNTDDTNHRDDMPSFYSSHNFLVVEGKEAFGAFFDTPSRVTFEIDYQGSREIVVICPENLRLVQLEGEDAYAVTKEFLKLIGKSFIPPLWAFGYGQSRWGYKTPKDFDAVVEGYGKAGIPLDYICMDIDYMDRYIDFTINKKRFPDFKGYVGKLKEKGIRLVPIIDAGVKIEPGNSTYEEGVRKGYFCTNHEGKNFQAAVWPGMTHFPDFFQPEAREWFGNGYQVLTDCGIEGFWNDMNEPAIFYSEYTKRKGLLQMMAAYYFPEKQEKETNAYIDYRNFYHKIKGKRVLHEEVHNLYGTLMTRAASEQLDKLLPTRFLLFSRSSYIGAHRYGGIWTGDNSSCWEHLRQNVYQMPSLNMCGFLYSGADTGGFGGNATRELLLRWLAFSVFTPLMRNHSSRMTRKQECYHFEKTEEFQSVISLRYRLLPYLYSEFVKAAMRGDMYFKPLGFEYKDGTSKKIQDQLLVGESMMVAPVVEQGVVGRKVYLPEEMTQVRYRNGAFACRALTAGMYETEVALDEVVFYIRRGKCVPVCDGGKNTGEVDLKKVQLLGDGEAYEQYLDDGFTKDVREKNIVMVKNNVVKSVTKLQEVTFHRKFGKEEINMDTPKKRINTSKNFRFALSAGAFSVEAFEKNITYKAGTISATNLKELQRLYIAAGSTEMFARIATKRESLEDGLALARLAAELNQPFNPEIMCAYNYMDMDKQEAPNFEEYPELYVLQNSKAWEELSLDEICTVLKSYGRLVAAEILSTGCTVQNWNLGNEANFGFAGISLGLKTAVNPGLEKISKIAGYMKSVSNPGWLSRNVWKYTAKAKAALAEGIKLGYSDLGIDSSDVVFSTHIATVVTKVKGAVRFFKTMQENGFDLGVAGISYYPSAPSPYINAMTMYKKLITSINKECNLPVFIAEFAYPTGVITGAYSGWSKKVPGYSISEEGQATLLHDVVNWGKSRGLAGIRYWAPDYSHDTWASMSMFRYDSAANTAAAKTILKNLLENHGLSGER